MEQVAFLNDKVVHDLLRVKNGRIVKAEAASNVNRGEAKSREMGAF